MFMELFFSCFCRCSNSKLCKDSPYSIAERTPELIPVLGSQPVGDVSHKPGGRLPLLSARPTKMLLAVLKNKLIVLFIKIISILSFPIGPGHGSAPVVQLGM